MEYEFRSLFELPFLSSGTCDINNFPADGDYIYYDKWYIKLTHDVCSIEYKNNIYIDSLEYDFSVWLIISKKTLTIELFHFVIINNIEYYDFDYRGDIKKYYCHGNWFACDIINDGYIFKTMFQLIDLLNTNILLHSYLTINDLQTDHMISDILSNIIKKLIGLHKITLRKHYVYSN